VYRERERYLKEEKVSSRQRTEAVRWDRSVVSEEREWGSAKWSDCGNLLENDLAVLLHNSRPFISRTKWINKSIRERENN